jgi:uncharacterized protein YdhG (YjbR/CyaY superfamily)
MPVGPIPRHEVAQWSAASGPGSLLRGSRPPLLGPPGTGIPTLCGALLALKCLLAGGKIDGSPTVRSHTENHSPQNHVSQQESSMPEPTTVEEYLAGVPEESRSALEQLRETIKSAASDATETISYQMPAFRAHGRLLVSYAAFKDHCSLFPMSKKVIEENADDLKPYFAGKGTLRFRADEPIPEALVRKIVEARLEENAARRRG